MNTERNQLASAERLHIWSLSDALLEKEAFQSERTHRGGLAKLILAENAIVPFHNSQIFLCAGGESSYGTFMWLAKALSTRASHCIY